MIRNATAVWTGSGKEGKGNLSTQSGVLQETQYSFNTRFADGARIIHAVSLIDVFMRAFATKRQ